MLLTYEIVYFYKYQRISDAVQMYTLQEYIKITIKICDIVERKI